MKMATSQPAENRRGGIPFDFAPITESQTMPKTTPAKPIKGLKPFCLADGTTRHLPDWADKPMKFAFSPDEALRRGMTVKTPKDWRKAIITGRKTRR
jgi:hypothetical protein